MSKSVRRGDKDINALGEDRFELVHGIVEVVESRIEYREKSLSKMNKNRVIDRTKSRRTIDSLQTGSKRGWKTSNYLRIGLFYFSYSTYSLSL